MVHPSSVMVGTLWIRHLSFQLELKIISQYYIHLRVAYMAHSELDGQRVALLIWHEVTAASNNRRSRDRRYSKALS